MFFITSLRTVAVYLMYVHAETAYVFFQCVAYLLNKTVLYVILENIKCMIHRSIKLCAIEIILSHRELKENLSNEEMEYIKQVKRE